MIDIDPSIDNRRIALQLAHDRNANTHKTPEEIVAEAHTYVDFLNGTPALHTVTPGKASFTAADLKTRTVDLNGTYHAEELETLVAFLRA